MARVVFEQVEKVYPGGFKAVRDLRLEVADGEFLVLVGPSGCGKSTTLRMIAGLETVTSGALRIGDDVVNDVHPRDRDIAMVFQSYALYPHMTVSENMAFGLRMRKESPAVIRERIAWVSETLGLESLLARRPGELSGGQRQRVALGRAIVRKPRVFLFDEPLSNLDARLRLEMRAELRLLHRTLGTTTVYVTHDQEEAMTLGDRIAVMNWGVMCQCGTPLEVYRQPVNRFVAGFLGTPPMNFVEGSLTNESGPLFAGGGLCVRPGAEKSALLESAGQNEVVLGVRPEAIRIHTDGSAGSPARVELVETLGGMMDVVLETEAASQRLVARVPADDLAAGTPVRLEIDDEGTHYFAPSVESDDVIRRGRNLTRRQTAS